MPIVVAEAVAPVASWRPPEALTYHRSLPLPPYTALVGVVGAALGLDLADAYQFIMDRELRLGVGGWCEGRARDLWKYQKLESIAEGKEIKSDVLLREQGIDARLIFVIECGDDVSAEAVALALSRPRYPLTAGTSDALLKVVAVRIDHEPPRSSRRLAFSMVYGELPTLYKLAKDLDEIPLSREVRAPAIERLPTGFVFDPVEPRRLSGRDLVTFVFDPVELGGQYRTSYGLCGRARLAPLARKSHLPVFPGNSTMDYPRPSLRLRSSGGSGLLHEALAKRKDPDKGQEGQSYWGHVTAVYDAWCGLKDVHAGLIHRTATRHGLTVDRVLRSSLLCVALHDVGKLSRNFQEMMRAEDDAAYKRAVEKNYRHEVAAIWLVDAAARALIVKRGPISGNGLLEVMAVAGHHKYLSNDVLFDVDRFKNPLSWEPNPWAAVAAALNLTQEMFHDQGWNTPLKIKDLRQEDAVYHLTHDLLSGGKKNPPFDCLLKRKRDLAQTDSAQHPAFRELFSLLKGLLMTADWMASGAVGREDDLDAGRSVVQVAPRCLEDHMHDRAEQKTKQFDGYKKFQIDCGKAPGHVIAVAPTGSGKTEASWLWALNQIEQGHARKIIVLLPTMVTSNSIHERLRDFFEPHGHQVGLVHSTADLVHESEVRGDEADRADVRSNNLSESHYFRPVTVGTVDQLLVPLFHAGRWAMKTFAAADAAVVIDEIHAYEPHTLGLITMMIEQLAALGTRFMIMSATMPADLKDTLHDALAPSGADLTPVEDDELLDSARNIWTISDKSLSESLLPLDATDTPVPSPEFLSLWGTRNDRGNPLKILVVVNTVARCQALSRAFREFGFELTCYHSKFIFDHRRTKERHINDHSPRLLIATQVVEVSLDIDYDILLTECAPVDALVHTTGRVNRARRATLGRVMIHHHDKKSEKVYDFPRGILETTWALFKETQEPTERDLIAMVEDVYQGFAPRDDKDFRGVRSATKNIQARQSGVLDAPRPYEDDALLKTRKDDYPQISVIPEPFAEEALKARPRDRKRFELKVPVWYARQHLDKSKDLPICAMHYDDEFGAELLATSEEPDPGNLIF